MPVRVTKKSETEEQLSYIVEVGTNSDDMIGFLVWVDREYYERLTGKRRAPEVFVERSFRFLLKREPCTDIKREFNVRDIRQQFPLYEDEMRRIFRVI